MLKRLISSTYGRLLITSAFLFLGALILVYFGIKNFLTEGLEKKFKERCQLETKLLASYSWELIKNYEYTQLYKVLEDTVKQDRNLSCLGIYEQGFPLVSVGNCKNNEICKNSLLNEPCYYKVTYEFNTSPILEFSAYFSTQEITSLIAEIRNFVLVFLLTVFSSMLSILFYIYFKINKRVSEIVTAIKGWNEGKLKTLKQKSWLKSGNEFGDIIKSVLEMYSNLEKEREIDNKLLLFSRELLNSIVDSNNLGEFLGRTYATLKKFFNIDAVLEYLSEERRVKIEIRDSADVPENILKIILNMVHQGISVLEKENELEDLLMGAVRALANAVDAMSPWTRGHSERVAEISVILGRKLGLDKKDLRLLEIGALLHDIGKLGVPQSIIDKPGKLTEEEFEIVKKHPEIGYKILEPIKELSDVLPIVLYHHEKCNGSGYPKGLKCNEIPLLAKIVAVADVVEAMTAERPYKKSHSLDYVINYILENSGENKLFDRDVVRALYESREEIKRILESKSSGRTIC
jgi:putative nucleotidyltransferase with HDIG domain